MVLSQTTKANIGDGLPVGSSLRPLGSHRLKDLGRPEDIFQLVIDGTRSEFPPLRSLDNPAMPNNLPETVSSFVGREAELAEVRRLASENRLVTLAGPGGVGKTRLALQAAAELLDGSGEGVWLVELATVSDPEAMQLRHRLGLLGITKAERQGSLTHLLSEVPGAIVAAATGYSSATTAARAAQTGSDWGRYVSLKRGSVS